MNYLPDTVDHADLKSKEGPLSTQEAEETTMPCDAFGVVHLRPMNH